MSFSAIGPIYQNARLASAVVIGTDSYPVGFTTKELIDLYWNAYEVAADCGSEATEGPIIATLDPFNGAPSSASLFGRRDFLPFEGPGNWTVTLPVSGGGTGNAIFSLFSPDPIAHDGALWYPRIGLAGIITATHDPEEEEGEDDTGPQSTELVFDNSSRGVSGFTEGVAYINGKPFPVFWKITQSSESSGSATYDPFEITVSSGWPP